MNNYSSNDDFSKVPVVWEPVEEDATQLKKFWKIISNKYNVNIDNYWDLHRWTTENIVQFWAEMWDYSKIIYSRTYDEVIDLNVSLSESPEWFKGSRLNYAENVLKYRDDHVALIIDGEDREAKSFTYSQMYTEACRYGAALKKLGLEKNDSVVCFMSNREEALFAMLGATAAGATWSGALPQFGAQAVVNRFKQTNPKFLFTVDRFVYNRKEEDMLCKLKAIANALPSLKKIIIVPSRPSSLDTNISDIRNSCFLAEFLAGGLEADGTVPKLDFVQLPFNHPVFISYTSGTTGTPKALVHGVGVILTTARDFWHHTTGNRDYTWLSISPVGWISWNIFTTFLSLGVSVVVYDGLPVFLSPTSLWDLVDKHRITNLFLSSSCLDEMEKNGCVPTDNHHLSSLKSIVSGASAVKLQNFDFVYKKVKSDVIFGSAYGNTEIMGVSMTLERTLPIYRGEISAPTLGLDIQCFDDDGNAVEGKIGELVITKPTPSFPIGILNDTDGKIYRNNYFPRHPGVFSIGDIALVNPVTKGMVVFGRSDQTLKPKGARFESSDIYNIVNDFLEILDSLCVSQYNGLGDERVVLFVKMMRCEQFTDDLVMKIRKTIEFELSIRHVPEVILETKDIPYNMNGKKMEIVVKKIINKMPYNSETVVNKECLEHFKDIPELEDYK